MVYEGPRHGGVDPGAIYKKIQEKHINLEISYNLASKLESLGATVFMTRYGDYDLAVPNTINRKRSDLSRRGNMINKSECDLYLSIHLNSDTSTLWQGAQVFYNKKNDKNKILADSIQKYFKQSLYSKRKVKETNEYYLHKRTTQPGVLVEVGFLSNPNDRYKLRQKAYQSKVSNSISSGLIEYFNKIK